MTHRQHKAAAIAGRALCLLIACAAAAACGCSKSTQTKAPPPPPTKQWTPEEMTKDPEGYLQWADAKVQSQIAAADGRRQTINERLAKVKARQDELTQQIADARNIRDRMQQAIQKSEDEDRLPIKMGGRSFEIDQAKQIVAQADKWVQDRQPLIDAYAQAVAKLQGAAAGLASDIDSMTRLREKLALDIEKVRLNQGLAELDQLRKTESEISSYATALNSSDSTIGLAELAQGDKQPAKVDIDSFLKP